jgi:sugar phosphate isomerase/epimerase
LHELLRDLDPRWLGCQYDIRHAVTAAGQSWPVTLELLHPWVRTTAWKDFRWRQSPGKQEVENVPIGEGVVDFPAYLERARGFGVGGPRSVHLEYPPFEGGPALTPAERRPLLVAGLRRDLAALKRLHGESAA